MATYKMPEIKCELCRASGAASLYFSRTAGFSFVKERYTPYTLLSGIFIGRCVPAEVTAVKLYIGSKIIHHGTADSVVCEYSRGAWRIRLRSLGFSMLLGQNMAEPGIISQPDLTAVIGKAAGAYAVSCQGSTKKVNYVYIKDTSTVWEAACIYAAKAYSTYPYIRGTNSVYCTALSPKTRDYSEKKIVSYSAGVKLTGLISHAHTQDAAGEWNISKTNSFATERHIIKHKYYARDNEWAYDPQAGLSYHIGAGDRGRQYGRLKYAGAELEELLDKANFTAEGLNLTAAEVDRIEMTCSPKGLFTELSFYNDLYCPQ